jgi:hypothetical protein
LKVQGISKPLIIAIMVIALYVAFYGRRIPITFSCVVATNKLLHVTRPCKPAGYIFNDNILMMLWPTSFVTVYNDGSCVIPSPALVVGPHLSNQFTNLFLTPMLLNPSLDEINSFMAKLLSNGKMLSILYYKDHRPGTQFTPD